MSTSSSHKNREGNTTTVELEARLLIPSPPGRYRLKLDLVDEHVAWFAQLDLSLMLNSLRSGANSGDFNLYSEIASVYRELGFPDLMRACAGEG